MQVPSSVKHFLAAVSIAFAMAPSFAGAVSVQTVQILPLGQNTCQPLSITSVDPHVYNGLLESFDITIADNSYVSVLGTVGNTGIPLEFMTRWSANGVRIHIDTEATSVRGGVPVSLTLLSAPAGQPVCMSVVSFEVTAAGGTTTAVTPVSPVSYPSTGPATSGNGTHQQPSTGPTRAPATTSTSTTGTAPIVIGSSTAGTSTAGLIALCAGNNAYRLWFILLALYVIIVALVVFAEPWYLSESVLGSTATILVPLVLLLGFWYFSAACRAASWIPVVACVIAIGGLFLAFREYESAPESGNSRL